LIWWVLAALVGLVAAGCAPVLVSSPHLVAVWPSAGSRLPVAPHTFELTFNRLLRAESTWASVWRDDDGALVPSETSIEPANPRRLKVRLLEPRSGVYRLQWHAVTARSGGEANGEQVFSMQDESAEAPRLQVTRSSAEGGDTVEIVGTGFRKQSPVRLSIGDDDQALTSAETDGRGAFRTQTPIPPGVPFGLQPVTAADASGAAGSEAVQVRWGGWPPLFAFTVGQPGPRPGDVTFSLSVRNRSDYLLERVRVTMADPDGGRFVAAEPATHRDEQAVVWDIPSVDRGVVGPFRATYRVSAAVAMHARVEFRHRRPHGCNGEECLPAFVSETSSESTLVYPAD
jgi:methionine-rich copper-binding protein CopC